MSSAETEIRQLLTATFTAERDRQAREDELDEEDYEDPYADYELTVTEDPATGQLAVAYHTVWWARDSFWNEEEGFAGLPLFLVLSRPELAGRLAALVVTAEDESGVNGTQDWSLLPLVDAPAGFLVLRHLALPLNEADTHHRRIVSYDDMYKEGNALGRLLDKCPALLKLAAPSAPGPGFFARETHGLSDLQLQCGYDHQGFIGHLAGSTCFPALARLEFRDFAESYREGYEVDCVPYAHYLALVSSATLPALRLITLLDTVLSEPQQAALTQAAAAHGRELRFGRLE